MMFLTCSGGTEVNPDEVVAWSVGFALMICVTIVIMFKESR